MSTIFDRGRLHARKQAAIMLALAGSGPILVPPNEAHRHHASTMNEASHRPTPAQIKTSTTCHTVFMNRKGVYTPMIVDNDQTDKLFKFGWV